MHHNTTIKIEFRDGKNSSLKHYIYVTKHFRDEIIDDPLSVVKEKFKKIIPLIEENGSPKPSNFAQ